MGNGSRILAFAATMLAVKLFVLPATAESAPSYKCWGPIGVPPDERIASCTSVIEGGRPGMVSVVFARIRRAEAYFEKDDFDATILDCTAVIEHFSTNVDAYICRATAYSRKGDLDLAITDFTEAIQLHPELPIPYLRRAGVYNAKGDFNLAMMDYDAGIERAPKNARGYFARGIAKFEAGSFAASLDDLSKSNSLAPKDPYPVLWLDIVRKRNRLPTQLPETTSPLDMTKWPGPVVRLFLGEITPEALIAAAGDPDAKKSKGQVCEANFYTGELALQSGSKNEAERLIRLAAADCPRTFYEWRAANSELKMFGASQ